MEFTISYISDNKNVQPVVSEVDIEPDDEKCVYIVVDSGYEYNELREMMRLKDYVLDDIRNKQISSYQLDGVEKVEIHVHPDADFELNEEYWEEY